MRAFLATLVTCLAVSPLHAQRVDSLVAQGDSLWEALAPDRALEAYRRAVQLDSRRASAWWKFARAQVDVAKQLGDDRRSERDSLYGVARAYAQSALNLGAADADAHFVMALVLGQQSRTRGGRERVQYARDIYDATARALALQPDHPGALHILGAWHAEVRRLSGLTRFFAKTLFGAGFLDRAEWDSAAVYLERSVRLEPSYVHHHLELAEIYLDLKRPDDAMRELRAVLALSPTSDVLDLQHRARANELLEGLTTRR